MAWDVDTEFEGSGDEEDEETVGQGKGKGNAAPEESLEQADDVKEDGPGCFRVPGSWLD